MSKLKVAVIGQGRSGRNIHGDFFKSQSNEVVEVVAVVELDPLRRERASKEYPGCRVYSDYKDLFDASDIDLVVNATYSEMHYPITLDLLNHGMNVLVEKPFARNSFECRTLIKAAKDHGAKLAVFQQTFFAPFYRFTREVIQSGKLGEIQQISIRYNGFARRWDWQTLQKKLAGSVYNTGPHPIGIALGLIDFDPTAKVVFSKIGCAMTSGDGEDYAKIIISAQNKPVIDIEINSTDAFSDYNVKIQGSRGTYLAKQNSYRMKYMIDEENEARPVIFESLRDAEGYPIYCGEKLVTHEEEGKIEGTAFDVGTRCLYENLRDHIQNGAPLIITNEIAMQIIQIIEAVHAENPLPMKY